MQPINNNNEHLIEIPQQEVLDHKQPKCKYSLGMRLLVGVLTVMLMLIVQNFFVPNTEVEKSKAGESLMPTAAAPPRTPKLFFGPLRFEIGPYLKFLPVACEHPRPLSKLP